MDGSPNCSMYTDMDASSLDYNVHAALPPPIDGYPALPPLPASGAGYQQQQSASFPWRGQFVAAPPPAPSGAAPHAPPAVYFPAPPAPGLLGPRPAGHQAFLGTPYLPYGASLAPPPLSGYGAPA
nr:formin-like protein 5 [Aegilops tauschii subsp. strangulata]